MNKVLLALVMAFKSMYVKMGADVDQLKAILHVRLLMDDRKPLSMNNVKRKKKTRFSSTMVVLVSLFSGFAFTLPLLLLQDEVLAFMGYFSMFGVFLTIMLITDFVTVLMDTRDRSILFPKPVDDKTLFLSRWLHILIYFLRIVFPMMLSGWVAAGIMWGWKGALYLPLGVLLLMMTVLLVVMGIYMLLLQFVTPQRFKEVISYFQIIFSVFVFGFYYLMPQLLKSEAVEKMTALSFPWLRGLPTYWIAAVWTWWKPQPQLLPYTQWLGVLAFIFPTLCMWATLKYLAPTFIRRIGELGSASSESHAVVKNKAYTPTHNLLYKRLAKGLNHDPIAQAGFLFTWLQTGRSRLFKMRVYPSFGYVPIYFLYFFFMGQQGFVSQWNNMPETGRHIALLYMGGFVMLQCMNYITYSDQYKAAWVYFQARAPYAGPLMCGAFKAAYIKYFLPFYALISSFVLYKWGLPALSDILLAGANVTFFTLLIYLLTHHYLPFSRMEQMKGMSGRTLLAFASLALAGVMGFGHYLALHILWLKLLFLVLSAILIWMCWDSIQKLSWDKVMVDDN